MIREYSKSFNFEHDGLEIEFTVEYNLEWDSYGVPGSPRWLTATDLKYSDYTINGVKYDDFHVALDFGISFLESLDEVASEMVEEVELDQ